MKVLRNKKEFKKEIYIEDVTFNHLVVAVYDNIPMILFKGADESQDLLRFGYLYYPYGYAITQGSYSRFVNESGDLRGAIEGAIEYGCKLEVFEQKDWKLAMQWLIDNTEG